MTKKYLDRCCVAYCKEPSVLDQKVSRRKLSDFLCEDHLAEYKKHEAMK